MTPPITERHRKLVYDIRSAPFASDEEFKMAADFEREVRLDEMKLLEAFWDRVGVEGGDAWDYMLERIASLEGQKT